MGLCLQPPASSLERRGFTLVELLIAATMMSVLIVGLGSHLRGGLTIWRRTTETVEALQRERVALDQLERDLAHAVLYHDARQGDYLLPASVFSEDQLRWVTVQRRAGGPRWTGTAVQRGGLDALRLVAYRCDEMEGVQGLWRTSQSVGEARVGVEAAPALLLAGCTGMALRYAYTAADGSGTLAWDGAWVYPDELPQAVEVTLQIGEGRTVQRVMTLPSGSLKSMSEAEGAP